MNLLSLPEEILLGWICPKLGMEDIFNLSRVNSRFIGIFKSEYLWQIKVQTEYSILEKYESSSWLEYYRYLINTRPVPVYHNGRLVMYARIGKGKYGPRSVKDLNGSFERYLKENLPYKDTILLYLGSNFEIVMIYPNKLFDYKGSYEQVRRIVIYPYQNIYNDFIYLEIVPKFSLDDLWGTIDEDGDFIIVDSNYGKPSFNNNKFVLGRKCSTYNISELLEILWHLKIPSPGSSFEDLSNENLKSSLKRYFGVKYLKRVQLLFYYRWLCLNPTTETLSSVIENHLSKTVRIMKF